MIRLTIKVLAKPNPDAPQPEAAASAPVAKEGEAGEGNQKRGYLPELGPDRAGNSEGSKETDNVKPSPLKKRRKLVNITKKKKKKGGARGQEYTVDEIRDVRVVKGKQEFKIKCTFCSVCSALRLILCFCRAQLP